jgi:ribose-phosphate pyrophosphokinase
LSGEITRDLPQGAVIVAPDLGAVKLAERYAAVLNGPVAVVRKQRESGSAVSALDVAGDVRGRPAVIVDDMITTGATIKAAVELLRMRGAGAGIVIAATHGLFVHAAVSRLQELDLRSVLVTDTVAVNIAGTLIRVCSIASTLADVIACLHTDKPLHQSLAPTP